MSKEKLTFDTITSKMVLGQLFKSKNIMYIVQLKTTSASVRSAVKDYNKKLTPYILDLAETHYGVIGKKEIDEIPGAKYIDPTQHLNDIAHYLQSNRALFKSTSEQAVIEKILSLINKTKYLLTLQ